MEFLLTASTKCCAGGNGCSVDGVKRMLSVLRTFMACEGSR